MKKMYLQFLSWVERASEFDSAKAIWSYAVVLSAFVAGLCLAYMLIFVWVITAPVAILLSVASLLLMAPYVYGLLYRFGELAEAM